MNDIDFKRTLIKALHQKYKSISNYQTPEMEEILNTIGNCKMYLEDTGVFTKIKWNTYSTILHIHVPVDKLYCYEIEKPKIKSVAQQIYGWQGDYYLTDVDINIEIEKDSGIDFSNIMVTNTIQKAISDAEVFMKNEKYDSAFDRVHTAFHGYIRYVLDKKNVQYEESDTLSQLYNKLHEQISKSIENENVSDLVKKTMRSMSGTIQAINEIRNRYSLAHPNESILSKREAEFVIHIIKDIIAYINEFVECGDSF